MEKIKPILKENWPCLLNFEEGKVFKDKKNIPT